MAARAREATSSTVKACSPEASRAVACSSEISAGIHIERFGVFGVCLGLKFDPNS